MAKKTKKSPISTLANALSHVPKVVWNILVVVAIVIMVAPVVWDFIQPETEVELEGDPVDRIVIVDDANLLTDDEEEALIEDMLAVAQYGAVGFFTNAEDSYVSSTSSWAKETYLEYLGPVSGTAFFIDMYNREIYIYSGNDVLDVITTSAAETITDNVYRMASRAEYYECAQEVYVEMAVLLQGDSIPEPMKHIGNAFLALACALLLVFVVANATTRMQGTEEKQVVHDAKGSFVVVTRNQQKVRETQTRRVSSDSGGGGGFSGGGGGGGGGFSGGGGGHGF